MSNCYKQKHPEACLAKCLMILVEKLNKNKIPERYELDLLIFSLRYGRENFVLRHLEKIARDFDVKINWILDTKIFFNFVKKMCPSKRIDFSLKRITLDLVDELLKKPLIIYTDRFYLWQRGEGLYYKYHYPHFIIILGKEGKNYLIIDTDDGKVKSINRIKLSKAIISLRNHLWMCPQIIQLGG